MEPLTWSKLYPLGPTTSSKAAAPLLYTRWLTDSCVMPLSAHSHMKTHLQHHNRPNHTLTIGCLHVLDGMHTSPAIINVFYRCKSTWLVCKNLPACLELHPPSIPHSFRRPKRAAKPCAAAFINAWQMAGTYSACRTSAAVFCRCAGVMMGRGLAGWGMGVWLPPGAWMPPACKPLTPPTSAGLTGATRLAPPSTALPYTTPQPCSSNSLLAHE